MDTRSSACPGRRAAAGSHFGVRANRGYGRMAFAREGRDDGGLAEGPVGLAGGTTGWRRRMISYVGSIAG